MTVELSDVSAFLDATRDTRMAAWLDFIRIPSVSALPEHAADCRRAAEWLASDLAAIGAEHVVVSETGGHPVVYGDWLHADGAPTVIAYGHYDVQPPDPLELWETAPFDPIVREGTVIARGAEDNKSCVQMHIRAAEALLRTRGHLPVNLRFLFEGEEESGSVHLGDWLAAHRPDLTADVAVISDTDFFEGNRPAICLGVRGLLVAQINVVGPDRDLHSGAYGGAVENPIHALAAILASLKAADGRILIPGFYDDVLDLQPAEREAIASLPFDEEAYQADLDVDALVGEPGYTTLERKTARPTLDENGIWGGFSGEGAKTIIPAEAHAKVSCRLVPNQRPEAVFETLRGARAPRCADWRPGHRRGDRRWPAQRDADRPPGDPGSRSCDRVNVRRAGALLPGRWQRPGQRDLQRLARAPSRALGLRAAEQPRT